MPVGSTNMSMTLPVEMSYIVQSCEGYVLEYVGDAIIAFFPSGYNKFFASGKIARCANQ
jgi:adenylate cyclase